MKTEVANGQRRVKAWLQTICSGDSACEAGAGGTSSDDGRASNSLWESGTDALGRPCGVVSGTFVNNLGKKVARGQTPVQLDPDTYIFGTKDAQWFKMASVDSHGQLKESRYTNRIEVRSARRDGIFFRSSLSPPVLHENLRKKTQLSVHVIIGST